MIGRAGLLGGGSRPVRLALPLFLLAVALVKGAVLAQLHDHPLLQPFGTLDAALYVALARDVEGGHWLGLEGAPFASPLYVYFLAAALAVTGGSVVTVRVVQAALGVVAVWLVWRTAWTWLGDRAAWIAGALAALTGPFTFNEVLIVESALDPFLTAWALGLLSAAWAAPGAGRLAGAGAVLGLLSVNRPTALVFAIAAIPLTAIAANVTEDGNVRVRRSAWAAGLLSAGLLLAVVLPSVRETAVRGEASMVWRRLGLDFYAGSETPSILDRVRLARQEVEATIGRPISDAELAVWLRNRAWAEIAADAGAAAAEGLANLAHVFNAGPATSDSFSYYARDEPTLLRWLFVGPWLLVPLGLVGVVAGASIRSQPAGRRTRHASWWAWAAFVPIHAVAIATFVVSGRARLALLVPLCVTSAAGALWLIDAVRARRAMSVLVGVSALALLALGTNWRLGPDQGRARERAAMAEWLVMAGRPAEALALLPRYEAEDPRPGDLNLRVGRALLETARPGDAIPRLERALTLEPGEPDIRFALGEAHLAAGRPREALPHLEAAWAARVRPEVSAAALARAFTALGDRGAAGQVLVEATGAAGVSADRYREMGELALALRFDAEAVRLFMASARRAPQVAATREQLGLALASLERPQEAIRELEEACRLDRLSATARLTLAALYVEADRLVEARGLVYEAILIGSDSAQTRELLDLIEELERADRIIAAAGPDAETSGHQER